MKPMPFLLVDGENIQQPGLWFKNDFTNFYFDNTMNVCLESRIILPGYGSKIFATNASGGVVKEVIPLLKIVPF